MPRSFPARKAVRGPTSANRSLRREDCGSPRSADLAGRSVALSADIPIIFDTPLAPHHRLIGRWVAAREATTRDYTRVAARRCIERTFGAAVRDILDPVDLADLRVTVLSGEADRPPALAIVCASVGQLDLGWIEDSEAPLPWRAAAYAALEQLLGRVLPVFGYQDLFETIALYYWDGETDDEAARHALIVYHGADETDLEGQTLPSAMNARRPAWMIVDNAATRACLPAGLRRRLGGLREAHDALGRIASEQDAWRYDHELVCDYIPGIEECSSLPPLTLVPFEQFACELDDVGRHGMEMGFMDVAGFCPLPEASRIDDWFASLRLGAQFLCAVQDLIRFDPND